MEKFDFFYGIKSRSTELNGWIWVDIQNLEPDTFTTNTNYHFGIHSFLETFPNFYTVKIASITGGPNFLEHTIHTQNTGWGFDILTDLIEITWVSYNDENIFL